MTGFLDLNTHLDTEYGERITVTQSRDTVRLDLFLNPDGLGFADAVIVHLSPLQARSLAALLLIQAEETERAS